MRFTEYLHIFLTAVAMAAAVSSCSKEQANDTGNENPSGAKSYLSLSIPSKDVNNADGSFDLSVVSNVPWTARVEDSWLSLSKDSADRGEVIKVFYQAGSQATERKGKIVFSASGLPSQTLVVTQKSKALNVSSSYFEVDNETHQVKLNVSANCAWSAKSNDNWLSVNMSTAQGNQQVTVTCQANATPDIKRTGTITISTDGLEPKVCKIVQGKMFRNPIGGIPDPYIVKDGNSYYLVKASTGINISRSDKLSELVGTHEVWRPDINSSTDWNTSHIWAPEMHKVEGRWYIYYAAGRPSSESGGSYKLQRSGVLRAKTDDPEGEWEDMGMLYTGDDYTPGIVATAANTKYAIDLTVFEHKGQLYAVWSGAAGAGDSNQSIFIATMSDPCTISCSRVRLSSADQPWELKSSRIQEGPAILKHGGKIFIIYSCNGSWTKHYRLGYLMIDDTKNLLEPGNWKKSPDQVFYRCDDTPVESAVYGINGVGHCSFTVSPDGKEDWIVYHAKNKNDNTYTTGRSSYLKRFTWTEEGLPDFGEPVAYDSKSVVPSGD